MISVILTYSIFSSSTSAPVGVLHLSAFSVASSLVVHSSMASLTCCVSTSGLLYLQLSPDDSSGCDVLPVTYISQSSDETLAGVILPDTGSPLDGEADRVVELSLDVAFLLGDNLLSLLIWDDTGDCLPSLAGDDSRGGLLTGRIYGLKGGLNLSGLASLELADSRYSSSVSSSLSESPLASA